MQGWYSVEAATNVLGLPTRVGIPQFEKETYRKPEYAGVIGMMKAAIEDAPPPVRRPQGALAWLKDMFRF
jgi:cell division ATPase FtsA